MKLLGERDIKRTALTFGFMSQSPDLLSRITTDPHICHGKAVVRGMRWPVQNVLELMASGMSIEEIMRDHPELEKDDFLACLDLRKDP